MLCSYLMANNYLSVEYRNEIPSVYFGHLGLCSLLIVYLDDQAIDESELLKSAIIIMSLSISPFMVLTFALYMEVLLCRVFIYLQLLHLLLGLNLSSSCSVCLCLFSVFKVCLSDMNFTIPDVFQFQFTWTTFFHPHTFNLYVSLDLKWVSCSVQFNLVTQSCPTLCDPVNRSTPGLPVHHQQLESTQTPVY